MKKIEAQTLEAAYAEASTHFECSVTELDIVVVQQPKKGFLGLMSKSAVIVARPKALDEPVEETVEPTPAETAEEVAEEAVETYPEDDESEYEEVYSDEAYYTESADDLESIAAEVEEKLNALFETICFDLEPIRVSVYDDNTLLVEFNGEDAALLIGKEGYRYKALSYMLFNWINTEYQLQLRLEIAEFLQNQEESVARYLAGVYENIDKDGHAQTRVLDGVLVQIALKQLRERYHDKYVAIRTTRDGGKYIIINDYHNY
ncbi:MAG: Jag N-terminal domain-containing protein [Campylobacterales bacterium]|jgi:spoIIIJ-associated protein